MVDIPTMTRNGPKHEHTMLRMPMSPSMVKIRNFPVEVEKEGETVTPICGVEQGKMSPWHLFEGKFNSMMHNSNNNGI